MDNKKRIKRLIRSANNIFKEKRLVPIPQPVNASKLLDGKIALITGGSGGIGMAIADSFLESGCKVIISGTNEAKLKECAKTLRGGYRF